MKISTDNGPIRTLFGDVKAVEMIAQAGFDGIDYTFYGADPQNTILALPQADMRALAADVRACADSLGVVFPQTHAPYQFKATDDAQSDSFQAVVRSMEFTALLGCKQIVVHTIKSFPAGIGEAEQWYINRRYMRMLLPYAEEYDLLIGLENLFVHDPKRGCYNGHNGTPQEINAFMDSLDSTRFRICCDLGHAAITGTEPEAFIRGMTSQRMTMLHVQDTDYRSDTHTLPYLGSQNWEEITSALAEIGFMGFMNLEVLHYYNRFPKAMIPDALKLAAASARTLAAMVEEKKAALRSR